MNNTECQPTTGQAPIVISLEESQKNNCTFCNMNELVHREQITKVCKILNERLKQAKGYDPESKTEYINDIISIFARRGAGKTTFVESLVRLIKEGHLTDEYNDIKSDLLCLDVLDPNRIACKENLVIRFIAQLHEVFIKSPQYTEKHNEKLVRDFEEAKQNLYESLPVIEGIGDSSLYSSWDDSAYLADRYMELTLKIKELEKRFHKYIASGLRLVSKKAVLFVLDDCDVSIENTFKILEILRMYFTSPQIILMMTGDAALYGMTIRKHYWNFFDQQFLANETMSSDKEKKYREYRKMVYRLETQYFQKMIRANHRIFLNNIYDKIKSQTSINPELTANDLIKVGLYTHNGKYDPKGIEEFYHKALELAGISTENETIYREYITHLLAQPLRNQVRIFAVYQQCIYGNNPEEDFSSGMMKVFEAYINQYSGDSKYLMAHTPIYPAWLLKFLVENNILMSCSSFLPTIEDDSLKNAIIALGISCTEQIRTSKSIIFDYWIRISLTRQLVDYLHIEDTLSELIDFVWMYSDIALTQILGRTIAYCNSASVPSSKKNIPGLHYTDVELISDQTSCIEDLIQMLQIRTVSQSGERFYIFSIYRILAIIGELLRLDSTKKVDYFNLLRQRSELTTFIEPYSSNDQNSIKENESDADDNIYSQQSISDIIKSLCTDRKIQNNDADDTSTIQDNEYSELINKIHEWATDKKRFVRIEPYIINQSLSRLFNAIGSSVPNDNAPLGHLISNDIISFWNSIIVEIFIASNMASEVEFHNDVNFAFMKNYSIFIKQKNKLNQSLVKFAEWILKCPLLIKYIDSYIYKIINLQKVALTHRNSNNVESPNIDTLLKIHLNDITKAFIRNKLNKQYELQQSISTKIDYIIQKRNLSTEYNITAAEIKMYESLLNDDKYEYKQKLLFLERYRQLQNTARELSLKQNRNIDDRDDNYYALLHENNKVQNEIQTLKHNIQELEVPLTSQTDAQNYYQMTKNHSYNNGTYSVCEILNNIKTE